MDPQLPPHIEFQYLVCSILPATPLSLVLFYQFEILSTNGIFSIEKLTTLGGLLFLAFSNLIFGLFIDIMRHHIEASFDSERTAAAKVEEEAGHRKGNEIKINFHLYEFSANFAIAAWFGIVSLLIGDLLKASIGIGGCYNSLWTLLIALFIAAIISSVLSWVPINPYLFCIDAPQEEENLNKGVVSMKLKKMFESKRFPLSEKVTSSKEKDDKWKITNGKKIYIIKKKKEQLNIYGKRKSLYRIVIPKDCIDR